MISSAHREIFIRYRYYNQFIRYALYELSGIPLPPQDDEIFSIGPDICLFDTIEVAEAVSPTTPPWPLQPVWFPLAGRRETHS